MRRVAFSVTVLSIVLLLISLLPVGVFASDLTLEKYVDCEIPEFLVYEGEDLAPAIDMFREQTGYQLYVAIKKSLNGLQDPSYEQVLSFYSDRTVASSAEDPLVVSLLVMRKAEGNGWKLTLIPSQTAEPVFDTSAQYYIQLYFDEFYENGFLSEYCLAESIRMIADGMTYTYPEHAVDPAGDPEEVYTDDDDPYFGMSQEEYESLFSQFEGMLPDDKPSVSNFFESGNFLKLFFGVIAAVIKIVAKKAREEKKDG